MAIGGWSNNLFKVKIITWILKGVMMEGRGSNIVRNCVTSLMSDPYPTSIKKVWRHHFKLTCRIDRCTIVVFGWDQFQLRKFDAFVDVQRHLRIPDEDQVVRRVRYCKKTNRFSNKNFIEPCVSNDRAYYRRYREYEVVRPIRYWQKYCNVLFFLPMHIKQPSLLLTFS